MVSSAWGIAIFVVTLLPYLYAYATQPPGKVFNGFFFIADDAATYISKMREGAEGAWGWTDRYVTTPNPQPVFLFMFYILWGKVAAVLNISLFAAYHLARLSGAIALVYAARALAAVVLPPASRRLAVVLTLVGSGAGYLLLMLASVAGHDSLLGSKLEALDLHLPELSALYSVIAIPHFAWAAALVAISLVQLIAVGRAVDDRGRLGAALLAALSLLALCFIHPQMLFVLAALAFALLLLRRPQASTWVMTALPFVVCVPLLAYFLAVLNGDAVIVEWSKQWKHQAPGFISLLFSLGVPLALALYAVARGAHRGRPELALMVAWLVLVVALLYIPNPVNIQRRLIDGLYMPVGMLAAAGIGLLGERLKTLGRRRLEFSLVSISAVSSLLVVAIAFRFAAARDPMIYIDRGEVDAFHYLGDHRGTGTPPGVLCEAVTGLEIPAWAGDRVYTGHYSETIDYIARAELARHAIRAGDPGLGAFMTANNAAYLLVGPNERAEGVGPLGPELLHVYDRAGVQIYRLQLPLPGP
jgi:hypothetical protein